MSASPDTFWAVDGYTKIVSAISVTLGAIYGAIRLAGHYNVTTRIRRRFRRKPVPTRATFAMAQPAKPRRRFGSIENPVATTPFAEERLKRYQRDGLA